MSDNTNSPSGEASSISASHDLTPLISPYLDLHMMFPLLEYVDSLISTNAISYDSKDVAKARLNLLRPTHMVDYAMDIYRELHGQDSPIPQEMEDQRKAVLKKLDELKADQGCKAFGDLCSEHNEALRNKLTRNGNWNVANIGKASGIDTVIDADVIETYRQLAKFNFDCGDYQASKDMLANIISLYAMPPIKPDEDEDKDDLDLVDDDRDHGNAANKDKSTQKTGNPNVYYLTSINTDLLQILWGKLSCEILLENWDEASSALKAVRLSIEQLVYTQQITALQALNQRTWLLHWSLFVFWNNSAKGLENMVELFFSEKYLQAITTNAPHLLRYLTAAVLLTKRRIAKSSSNTFKDGKQSGNEARKLLRDLVRLMNNCEYSDPIVEFVDCLCVKFDFEGAQTKLAECEHLLKTDFFLLLEHENPQLLFTSPSIHF